MTTVRIFFDSWGRAFLDRDLTSPVLIIPPLSSPLRTSYARAIDAGIIITDMVANVPASWVTDPSE